MEKLGEAQQELWQRNRAVIQKQEIKRGMYMEDLSYMPQQ
jgi:hypothetical protein